MPDSVTLNAEKGGNPEIVRESQRRRFVNKDYCDEKVALVDKVIDLDKQWREGAEHVPYCVCILRTTAAASCFADFVQKRAASCIREQRDCKRVHMYVAARPQNCAHTPLTLTSGAACSSIHGRAVQKGAQ